MRRREFIIMLGSAVASAPFAARAEQPARTRGSGVRVRYSGTDARGQRRAKVGRREFETLGWTVGGNLQIKVHWGTGDADWVRSAAAEVLGETPDVMLANGDAAVQAALHLTRTVPIIFIGAGDPVGEGWVQSLA